ncbi:MAG: LuxR C-terminal-related transcriptional regulator [Tannerellaceae bacterium]
MGVQFKEFNELLTDEAYHQTDPIIFEQTVADLIRLATVYSKATNSAFMIVCSLKREVYYISQELVNLTGYTNEELREIGNKFIKKSMIKEENELIKQMSRQAYEEVFRQRTKNNTTYHVSVSKFRITHKLGHWINLENTSYPLCHLNDRSMFLVCYVRETQNFLRTELEIYYPQEKMRHVYNYSKNKFIKSEKAELNTTEYQILKLTATGYKEYQIEKKMQLDINTIKYYKKKIMSKLSVNSMTEAVYYALNNKIL